MTDPDQPRADGLHSRIWVWDYYQGMREVPCLVAAPEAPAVVSSDAYIPEADYLALLAKVEKMKADYETRIIAATELIGRQAERIEQLDKIASLVRFDAALAAEGE